MKTISSKDIILPKRKKNSHKGENGRLLIIGGSSDYSGALALAGIAALRSGADWVTVAAPKKAAEAVSCLSADLVIKKYNVSDFKPENAGSILTKEEPKYDAVLIGNGIGTKSRQFTKKYLKNTKKNIVVDADAIKHASISLLKNSVITPHSKELEEFLINSKIENKKIKKIISEKNPEKKAGMIKKELQSFLNKNNIILLKGKTDIIISKNKIAYNKTGNPGMTKAGTGDVLAGVCAGFLSQGLTLFQSAVNAAYLNGLAGDILLKKKKGFFFLASDLAHEIKKLV